MSTTQTSDPALIDAIDELLAQTQCRECGYPACRLYAVAIAAGDAANKCRPGAEPTARALAMLLARAELPLALPPYPPAVAWIDPERCIGCARCLPACPVDAIVGAQPLLHTVIGDECTGCRLCVAPCPVDCIEIRALPASGAANTRSTADLCARYLAHEQRAQDRERAADASRRERIARRRQRGADATRIATGDVADAHDADDDVADESVEANT